jgi:hypothetical protein
MSICYKVRAFSWSILLRSVKIFTPTDHLKVNLSVQFIDSVLCIDSVQCIDLLLHCYDSHVIKSIFLFKEESQLHTHVGNSQIWAASIVEVFPVFRLTFWLPSSGWQSIQCQ